MTTGEPNYTDKVMTISTEFQMNRENKETAQAYFSPIAEALPGIQAEHAVAVR